MATLYLAVYPSAAPTPTWDRTTGWSGSPVYTDADASPESSGSYTFAPDSSGLTASTSYVWYAVWDDGTDTVGPVASGAFETLADAILASGAITERADTASGTASLSWPAITASGAAQERRDAASGALYIELPAVVAHGAVVERRDIAYGRISDGSGYPSYRTLSAPAGRTLSAPAGRTLSAPAGRTITLRAN